MSVCPSVREWRGKREGEREGGKGEQRKGGGGKDRERGWKREGELLVAVCLHCRPNCT